jgi:molecular chaperone GrpE
MMENWYPNGSDAAECAEEEKAGTDPQVVESDKPAVDPTAQLQADLEAAREEEERWHDRFLRKAAELENFRKRVEKEKKDWTIASKSSVFLELLPIMDACERALNSFDGAEEPPQGLEQYKEGVELLYRQLSKTLARLGVVPIESQGRKFDPNFHEALTRLETMEYEENTVISELTRGYMFQDRLLRPAQVVVATRPKLEHPPGQ